MVAYQFRQQNGKADRDRYLHKFDLPIPPVPVLQRPLASSTPVYGHDYVQKDQREDALFPPNSSREGMAKGPAGLQQPESGNVPNSEESSEDPLQEQPFDGDPPLFPETLVRCKKQLQETEHRSPSSSRPAAGDTGNERVERERMPPKHYHY